LRLFAQLWQPVSGAGNRSGKTPSVILKVTNLKRLVLASKKHQAGWVACLMLWMNCFKSKNSLMGRKYSLDYAF
jgi:hypothetical protein